MSAFLGIYREPICSPGRHRENDAEILELVAADLERRGHRVALSTATEAGRFATAASTIFSMSRSPRILALLAAWELEGRTVVNRPGAVLATARSALARTALGGVSVPPAHLIPTARGARAGIALEGEWWVKGGDLYASRREDVQRVTSMEMLDRVLDDFERRGIATAVLQEDIRGREIKFYAVGGGGLFYWLDTKAPSINGYSGEPFEAAASRAGATLALEIFGGDLVIDGDGRAILIDLNDWPSFAPCRAAAARAIAQYLEARASDAYAAPSPAGSATPSASA
jgi:hypothetical protein